MRNLLRFNFKIAGIILTTIFHGATLYAQQSLPKISQANSQLSNARRPNLIQIEVKRQQKWAEEEVKIRLVPEAVAIVKEIETALDLIDQGKTQKAQTAIKRATNKMDSLLAHYPNPNIEDTFLPIDFNIEIIERAPRNLNAILNILNAAETAGKNENYPSTRLLLGDLQSEIVMTTYHLSLATVFSGLKAVESLLDQKKKIEKAHTILKTILKENQIATIQQILPIPIIRLNALLVRVEELQKEDKKIAVNMLNHFVLQELERAKILGYMSEDKQDYDSLKNSIQHLAKQIENDTSNPSEFQSLRNKIDLLLKRQFERKKEPKFNKKNLYE